MQEYKTILIRKDELLPLAARMREQGTQLAMIHGYLDDAGQPVVSYEFEVGAAIESYTVKGEFTLPTISLAYGPAAEWPERELNELIGLTFEGLDVSKRLFLPESMLSGQGQILVTPMEELIRKAHGKEEQA